VSPSLVRLEIAWHRPDLLRALLFAFASRHLSPGSRRHHDGLGGTDAGSLLGIVELLGQISGDVTSANTNPKGDAAFGRQLWQP